MQALVTGGGGFLGTYLVEQLLARGGTVRVFCRGSYPHLDELGVAVVNGDVRDAAAVATACAGVDTVFHVAALPGVWGAWKRFHAVNTLGTKNVIAGCREHGVKRLVYTGSPSAVHDGTSHVDGNELRPYPDEWPAHYPHSKALAEQAVLAANGDDLATCAIRPHLIWGPRDNHLLPRLVQRAKTGRLRRIGDGTNLVSVTYVENAAAAHLQAADALEPGSKVAGEAFFVNEPEAVNLWDFVDDLVTRAGLPRIEKSLSHDAARRVGAACETLWSLFRLPGEPPMTRFLADELALSHAYDVSKAQRCFGYRPVVPFEEALRRTEPELKRLAAQ